MKAVANTLGQQIPIFSASNEHEINMAFADMVQQRVGALLVGL